MLIFEVVSTYGDAIFEESYYDRKEAHAAFNKACAECLPGEYVLMRENGRAHRFLSIGQWLDGTIVTPFS